MRIYHQIANVAAELATDGNLSWKEAIEEAKRVVLDGQADKNSEDELLQNKNTLL